jgi:TPP-dependent pyruvate/acetoin dehydrogenase alpha subunit
MKDGFVEKDIAADIAAVSIVQLYVTMLRIRKFEEKVAALLRIPSEIVCPVHLYIGQEAVAAGVCANLKTEDYVFSTHRSHGHYIAKGGELRSLMAELYGKATGCSRGRGGSMHLASPDIGLLGSSAIVAGTIPLAVGAALAASMKRKGSVSVSFFGDGATNEGVLYESLNIAVLRRLPVVFVCENNLYSTHLPISKCLGDTDIRKKAEAFGMPSIRIDGNDVLEVRRASAEAIERARSGGGPTFIECLTYRWLGHVGPNDDIDKGLRSERELESWKSKCPIARLENMIVSQHIVGEDIMQQIHNDISSEIEDALIFARTSLYPEESTLLNNVFRN